MRKKAISMSFEESERQLIKVLAAILSTEKNSKIEGTQAVRYAIAEALLKRGVNPGSDFAPRKEGRPKEKGAGSGHSQVRKD